MDLDIGGLSEARLGRLAKAMAVSDAYEAWREKHSVYLADEDVRENAAIRMRW